MANHKQQIKMIQIKNLSIQLNKKTIINNISYTFDTWSCTAIIGNNGAGKTCLLQSIIGQIKPSKGTINCDSSISYAPDALPLPPWLNPNILRKNEPQAEFFAKKTRRTTNQNTAYQKLSQGNKQKINLINSLCYQANIYIRDEPTQHLDPESRYAIHTIIKELKQQKKTIIYSTHFLEDIWHHTDQCIILDQGSIQHIIDNPTNNKTLQSYFQRN